jgi:hypothetical protein
MDMGLIGGLALAFGVSSGCEKACEMNPQGFVFLCVLVLVAATGSRYVIKHSGGNAADQKKPSATSKKSADSLPP